MVECIGLLQHLSGDAGLARIHAVEVIPGNWIDYAAKAVKGYSAWLDNFSGPAPPQAAGKKEGCCAFE